MSVNHEVKGQLAKLLATENLIIEHKKVPTACFDVLNRVLTLPIWNRASSVVYDLLVGHEVGHALYTPNEDWTKKISSNVPKDYVNVVEDARIEKLMKRKFPGLARTFYNGYSELNRDDFFGIADEDMSKLTLIDRINLHFKIGAYACIPFKEPEQHFVEMIDGAETFDDVLRICEMLVEYIKDNQVDSMSSFSGEFSEDQQASSNSGTQQQNNNQSELEGSGNSIPNQESESQDGENKEQDESDSVQDFGGRSGSGPEEKQSDETVSKTQQNFDDQAQKLTAGSFQETYYVERPVLDIKKVVVPCDTLVKYVNQSWQSVSEDSFKQSDKTYNEYRSESQKEVNYLVKEFEMKKSADAYQRMATARTGVLDTKMLHTYKYNDDIFRKVSVIPDGKNHGLIFVLDWSGSMTNYLLDTVKQLFNLIWFCKKVQIPFEVYGFTYEWSNAYVNSNYKSTELYTRRDGTISVHRQFSLLNFISSSVNNKVLDNAMLNLWRLAYREDKNTYDRYSYSCPHGLDLSGTPLNESIIALHQIIPDFKTKKKVQKINVVILTDGEANNINYDVDLNSRYGTKRSGLGTNYLSSINALRDRKTGNVYRNFSNTCVDSVTTILLENLKHNFPEVNLIGFRIVGGSSFSYFYREMHSSSINKIKNPEEVMKIWRKEKTYEINGIGYDALYMISSSNLSSSNTAFEVQDDSDVADIGKAFRTMLKKKATNKKLLSSFATLVS